MASRVLAADLLGVLDRVPADARRRNSSWPASTIGKISGPKRTADVKMIGPADNE